MVIFWHGMALKLRRLSDKNCFVEEHVPFLPVFEKIN